MSERHVPTIAGHVDLRLGFGAQLSSARGCTVSIRSEAFRHELLGGICLSITG